ncbi:Uncharacterised protein [Mycobacteroides abscessus subsp. bolletii]|uniref:DUF7572 domain-containing protein n=1 Tax=Mycobacteroides abscessus subsp. bolletii TaxID=319705 RepID=A0A9Q7SEV7_9MYCO|nr:hypothetical protein [Mycobacteroides abscessus]SHT86434.1 Uncharacterised protein [Mycobacteroides abscessus subsp. bolletii]SHU01782.1 Uncharacterised protein [Mycobacteroides abscessus subsp. bolletii]SHX43453.1 Uncharacterised protein [Mycobacteroides abscessus subsp. bolletii]SKM63761.1 Uncharacterised protein [Mycobacteroides abscessus subsp. bolletii]SKN38511.1 Uncharacterised protein [Mycobacteroides abscessus subsp. bolletii]
MPLTATLIDENLRQFCPTTNHYRCTDGERVWHLLVTIPSLDSVGMISEILGTTLPAAESHLVRHADVFLADENAAVIDADGNPANGMTALAQTPNCDTHAAALAELGYDLN